MRANLRRAAVELAAFAKSQAELTARRLDPFLQLLERVRRSSREKSRSAWLSGQLQPDEAQGAGVRRPRLRDGAGAGIVAVARRRRALAGHFRGSPRASPRSLLRRADQGPHPRIGVRRRRAVRLRRRRPPRHLPRDRRGAHAGARAHPAPQRALPQPRRLEVRGRVDSRRAWTPRPGAAACAPATSTATAASISTSRTGGRTSCSATAATARSRRSPSAPGVAAGGWSTGCTFFDADADGDLDLYVARYVETTWDAVVRAQRTLVWRNGPRIMVGPAGLPGEADLFFENLGNGRFIEAADGARPRRCGARLRLRRRRDRLRRRRVRRSVRGQRLEPELPLPQPRQRPLRERRACWPAWR